MAATPGQYLNLDEMEMLLQQHHKESFQTDAFEIDLGKVSWISPLSTSLLHTWLWELDRAGRRAVLRPPAPQAFAGRYLSTSGFLIAAERIATISGQPPGRPLTRLAAFETFSTEAAAANYISELSDERQQPLILHFDEPPSLVVSGHFHSVVLKELLDNAFIHGGGVNAHYCALDANPVPTGRSAHLIYAPLSGGGYIEVCVADSSETNLLEKLRDHVNTNDDLPEGWIDPRSGTLDESERIIAAAFAYGSTSDPARRHRTIAALADTAIHVAELSQITSKIVTGLHTLARLAEGYGGQVIVRTAGRLGTLDYSAKSALRGARIAFWRSRNRAHLVNLSGTVVILRVPKEPYQPLIRSLTHSPTEPSREIHPKYLVVGAPSTASSTSPSAALAALETDAAAAFRTHRDKNPLLVAVVLDGLDLDSKAAAALVVLLSLIPRRGGALLVLAPGSHVDLAGELWQVLSQSPAGTFHLQRPPSLVVASTPGSPAATFGDPTKPDATAMSDQRLLIGTAGDYVRLDEAIVSSRTLWIQTALALPSVRHDEYLFLIESSYYVPRFYEIGALVAEHRYLRTLTLWLSSELDRLSPTVLVCFSDALRPVVADAVKTMGRAAPEVLSYTRTAPERRVLLEASVLAGATGTVVILVDVLATARMVMDFLSALPTQHRHSVLTVVDARTEPRPYLPVLRDEHTEDVPVSSVLVDPVKPIYKRPPELSAERIVIVDRATNRPVRHPIPRAGGLSREVVGHRLTEAHALAEGHFTYRNRHYAYFLALKPLFQRLAGELETWIRSEAEELAKTAGVIPANTAVYCLDEDTGLFEVAARAIPRTDYARVQLITREDLAAPPAKAPLTKTVWFVLPAMDTGRTIRQALEYARAFGAETVRASVVTSRASPDVLAFFQRIRTYDQKCDVALGLGVSVPLDATSSDECAGCRHIAALTSVLARTANEWPDLRRRLQERIDDLEAVEAKTPGEVGQDAIPADTARQEALWSEVRLLALYVRGAGGDIGARKELEELLKESGVVLAFVRGVGRHVHTLPPSSLRDVLYGNVPFDSTCRQWASSGPRGADLSLYLQGFAALAPATFREVLPDLLREALVQATHLDAYITEAMREPALYFDAVTVVASSSPEAAAALYELRQFLRSPFAEGVGVFERLYASIVRSSTWSTELTKLMMRLRSPTCTSGDVCALLERWREGFVEARALWMLARQQAPAIIERLRTEGQDPAAAWAGVEESAVQLLSVLPDVKQDAAVQRPLSAESVQRIQHGIAVVRECTLVLTRRVAKLALRVSDGIRKVRSHLVAGTSWDVAIDVAIQPGCPLLAMLSEDFVNVIIWLLENSKRVAPTVQRPIRLSFVGRGSFVQVTVDDAARWRDPPGLEGGLHSIRRTCSIYGGRLELPFREGDLVRVLLPSWQTLHGLENEGSPEPQPREDAGSFPTRAAG